MTSNSTTAKPGIARKFVSWLGVITGWKDVASHARWIREGASHIDPRKYPWNDREKWMRPAKVKETFEGAMYRHNADEKRIGRNHLMFSLSAYVGLFGSMLMLERGMLFAYERDVAGVMAAIGAFAPVCAAWLCYSFQAWKLRTRDINSDFPDFLAAPTAWFPPLRYRLERTVRHDFRVEIDLAPDQFRMIGKTTEKTERLS